MQVQEIDRDMLYLLAGVLLLGIILGLLLAPRGGVSRNRAESNNRLGTNIVFGNIVVGTDNEITAGRNQEVE